MNRSLSPTISTYADLKSEMIVIGLTGGIGSGKSTAGRFFETIGINVVDVDQTARAVVALGEPALTQIADHFGHSILLETGELDRAQLRAIVFSDTQARIWLEQLTHPLIQQRAIKQLLAHPKPYGILMSPLLFETDQHLATHYTIAVDLPVELQLARASQRDHSDPAAIQRIIDAQISREARCQQADFILSNDQDLSTLQAAVEALHQEMMQRIHTYSDFPTPKTER